MDNNKLADEGLPFTGAARVTGNSEVGLQAHLAEERREYFALVESATGIPLEYIKNTFSHVKIDLPGVQNALELSLQEELTIKVARGRVEWRAGDSCVDIVSSCHGVSMAPSVSIRPLCWEYSILTR